MRTFGLHSTNQREIAVSGEDLKIHRGRISNIPWSRQKSILLILGGVGWLVFSIHSFCEQRGTTVTVSSYKFAAINTVLVAVSPVRGSVVPVHILLNSPSFSDCVFCQCRAHIRPCLSSCLGCLPLLI